MSTSECFASMVTNIALKMALRKSISMISDKDYEKREKRKKAIG